MNNPQLSELLTEYTRALACTDIKGPVPTKTGPVPTKTGPVPDIPTLIS